MLFAIKFFMAYFINSFANVVDKRIEILFISNENFWTLMTERTIEIHKAQKRKFVERSMVFITVARNLRNIIDFKTLKRSWNTVILKQWAIWKSKIRMKSVFSFICSSISFKIFDWPNIMMWLRQDFDHFIRLAVSLASFVDSTDSSRRELLYFQWIFQSVSFISDEWVIEF